MDYKSLKLVAREVYRITLSFFFQNPDAHPVKNQKLENQKAEVLGMLSGSHCPECFFSEIFDRVESQQCVPTELK